MENGSVPATTAGIATVPARMRWGVRIPLRDGTYLHATLYLPTKHALPAPTIVTLTPYVAQTYHDRGMSFAAHGYPFLAVDVRGRGNSEGTFVPCLNDAKDGYDVVEWVATQTYCNGQVAMWGGSYSGYVQWATAKEFPRHLATIAPAASLCMGVDFPICNNIATPYWIRWLTLVAGRTLQDRMFWNNERFWADIFREWFESGVPFKDLDTLAGNPSSVFAEWVAHPGLDPYWDQYNPTAHQYAEISVPVLTITGAYDGDQRGALTHYREHLARCSVAARERHYLVIGPWDHSGTRDPKAQFCGIVCGPASLVDLDKLHRDWYAWTLQRGPQPEFLQKHVTYYVMGADTWRYADSLDAITQRTLRLNLSSRGNPTDVLHSGFLGAQKTSSAPYDFFVYDPRDTRLAGLESTVSPDDKTDSRMIHAASGAHLVYDSEPFGSALEISGFFRLSAWLAIDQPDTDLRVRVYAVGVDGNSVELAEDALRARYRGGVRHEQLIETAEPLLYEFTTFNFISRRLERGERVRLVIGPSNSIYKQKNYNSGGVVAAESVADARTVTVRLFHDERHSAVLDVPIGVD